MQPPGHRFALLTVRGLGACRVVLLLSFTLPSPVCWAADPLPRSVLILDQSDRDSTWYAAFSPAFRSILNSDGSADRISIYAEHLDLSRFQGTQHDESLRTYLRDKYRERRIGVLIAQGSSALEFVVRSRDRLW